MMIRRLLSKSLKWTVRSPVVISSRGISLSTARSLASACQVSPQRSFQSILSDPFYVKSSRGYHSSMTLGFPTEEQEIERTSVVDSFHELVALVKTHQERHAFAARGRRRSVFLFLGDLALNFSEKYDSSPPVLSKIDCARVQIIDALVSQDSLTEIQAAVMNYTSVADSSDPDLRLPVSQLRRAATPFYEDLFKCLLESSTKSSLQFLMNFRADVHVYIRWLRSKHDRSDHLLRLKQLESHLRELLSTWVSPSLLEVHRIQYKTTPAAIIEHIVRNEAVHPVKSLADLRTRLGPGRRVFALAHPLLDLPLILTHVSLQRTDVPARMQEIYDSPPATADRPRVAVFYSISNLEAGLAGMGLGEFLIKKASVLLRERFESLETMCTLSPVPGFKEWLATHHGPSPRVAELLGCTEDDALPTLRNCLESNELPQDDSDPLAQALMYLAAKYLVQEKHRGQPLNPVTRFHIGNGASIYRINWNAQHASKNYGIMVNYEYGADYPLESEVSIHPQVLALLNP